MVDLYDLNNFLKYALDLSIAQSYDREISM